MCGELVIHFCNETSWVDLSVSNCTITLKHCILYFKKLFHGFHGGKLHKLHPIWINDYEKYHYNNETIPTTMINYRKDYKNTPFLHIFPYFLLSKDNWEYPNVIFIGREWFFSLKQSQGIISIWHIFTKGEKNNLEATIMIQFMDHISPLRRILIHIILGTYQVMKFLLYLVNWIALDLINQVVLLIIPWSIKYFANSSSLFKACSIYWWLPLDTINQVVLLAMLGSITSSTNSSLNFKSISFIWGKIKPSLPRIEGSIKYNFQAFSTKYIHIYWGRSKQKSFVLFS